MRYSISIKKERLDRDIKRLVDRSRNWYSELDMLSTFDGHFDLVVVLDHVNNRAERRTTLAQNEHAVLRADSHVNTSAATSITKQHIKMIVNKLVFC